MFGLLVVGVCYCIVVFVWLVLLLKLCVSVCLWCCLLECWMLFRCILVCWGWWFCLLLCVTLFLIFVMLWIVNCWWLFVGHLKLVLGLVGFCDFDFCFNEDGFYSSLLLLYLVCDYFDCGWIECGLMTCLMLLLVLLICSRCLFVCWLVAYCGCRFDFDYNCMLTDYFKLLSWLWFWLFIVLACLCLNWKCGLIVCGCCCLFALMFDLFIIVLWCCCLFGITLLSFGMFACFLCLVVSFVLAVRVWFWLVCFGLLCYLTGVLGLLKFYGLCLGGLNLGVVYFAWWLFIMFVLVILLVWIFLCFGGLLFCGFVGCDRCIWGWYKTRLLLYCLFGV